MAFVDYYKILGVDKTIPQKDVKRAYLKRAKLFHPDLHPDDPKAKAKFQALNEAYDVIGDPDKRRKYDQYGEQWKQADQMGGGFGGGRGGGSPFEGFDFSGFTKGGGGFSSFFENLFGGGHADDSPFGGFAHQQGPQESHASVSIDMYTALLGGEVIVTLQAGTKLKLKIKPGTQPGTKVRLRGKGQGGGDLIITYQVTLPATLTDRQRQLLEEMRRA
jgi:curved DNA-binding protein